MKFAFVSKVLLEFGENAVYYQVVRRPGMPLFFGIRFKGHAIFGSPGNPVSILVCLVLRDMLPAIADAMGTSPLPRERPAVVERYRW